MSGVRSVTGTICQFLELGHLDSKNASGMIAIRNDDGTVVEIENLAISEQMRPELAVGTSGTFHYRTYSPAQLNFILAIERGETVAVYKPISAFYVIGLLLAIVAANLMTIPISIIILERFFTSTLSRLVFVCVYIGLLGYGLYVIAEIGSLYFSAAKLDKTLRLR